MEMDDSNDIDNYQTLRNIRLRSYQINILKEAKKQNSIVFLPTGSGKTLIALHVLNSKMTDTIGPFPEKAKRIFILSPTKILVYQLFKIVSIHTKFKVGVYTGDMLVDFWDREKWMKEFQKYQVLIMTGEILKHILHMKFIEPCQVGLIIFDECHHAAMEHPYNLILEQIAKESTSTAPLVLGLSAVLLNANPKKKDIREIILNLTKTFRGKILMEKNLHEIRKFSANPMERILPYNSSTSFVEKFIHLYDEAIQMLEILVLKPKGEISIPRFAKFYSDKNRARKIKNCFVNAKEIFKECGLFCGSLSLLYYVILFEKYRLMSTECDMINILVYCRTILHKIRHIFLNLMGGETGESIFEFSSNKIQVLLELLKSIVKNAGKKHPSTVIFVKQKVTAVVIATMLKRLKIIDPNFSSLNADFIVGSSLFSNDTFFHNPDNEETVKKFSSQELNCLVATSVLEEGMDFSACNAVICFDFPVSYASYFQSRGRVRDKEGVYYLLVERENVQRKQNLLSDYKKIEDELYKAIQTTGGNNIEDFDSLLDLDEKDEKIMLAIKTVYRYCGKLPQDKYSYLSPTAWYRKFGDKEPMFKASLMFPVNCPIKDVIEGDLLHNSKLAKRSVFLKAMEKLQEIGELDENLNIVSVKMKAQLFDYLFPHYKAEKIPKHMPQPGTRKRKQTFKVKVAECLSECLPQPDEKAYLHVIDFAIKFDEVAQEQKTVLLEVLKSPVTFAILSTKRLYKICEFPMFLNMGQINCNLLINHDELVLSKSELEDIKLCHFAVFQKVLRIIKNAQVFDNTNKGHSFYVVPVKKNEEGRFTLDWDVIRCDFCKNNTSAVVRYSPFQGRGVKKNFHDLDCETSSSSTAVVPANAIDGRLLWGDNACEQNQVPSFAMTEADYKYFVISPNYRNVHSPQLYVVSKFYTDLSPLSPFPNDNFEDYCSYYEQKYAIRISNEKQPLMKVAFVFTCANFNKPRSWSGIPEKGTHKNQEELLVPELCDVFPFDRRYWLKALLIPTALNRICHLYCVEEFRRKIVLETGLGTIEPPNGREWKPLEVDFNLKKNEDETAQENVPTNLNLALPLSRIKNGKTKSEVNFANLYEVGLCDLEYVVKLEKNLKSEEEEIEMLQQNFGVSSPSRAEVWWNNLNKISPPLLKVFKGVGNGSGPDLAQLLQTVTSSQANDVISYERLEILGDSFLKFAVTLFLFKNFKENEGMLTLLKGKMVGNRNLLYCGLAKGFQNVINVTDFAPLSDWNPPLVCLPEKLVDVILESNADPAVIYRWSIPFEEQFSGDLSQETFSNNKELIETYQKSGDVPVNSLLPYTSIGDKIISDSVEAVIGVYLWEFGLPGGFEILTWLDVLPKSSGSYSKLIGNVDSSGFLPTPNLDSVMNILSEVFYTDLETTLGYQFKNKALLLEAITHPSYSNNRVTDCYQRLEFLGDAILDFLITSYVYEYCGDLTPGEVTDIRSSLVNNITFASLAVRYDFHKYLLKMSSKLNKAIEECVSHQIARNYVINESVLFLLDETDCLIAEAVQVPKALGDIFESLAGAIYLDSGNSLETVWTIFYRLMKNEIDTFTKAIPKSSVRLLHEVCEEKPYFEVTQIEDTTQVSCTVWYENAEIKVYGFGRNKKEAKRSAAKLALKKITELKK